MICGEATTTVGVSPDEVLAFVADIDRYRRADTKIGRVRRVERDGDDVVVRFRARIRGLPGPVAHQRMHITPGERIDITDMPSWQTRLLTFHGSVTCEATAKGTTVTHREEFHFHGPLRPLLDRVLGRWLAEDVVAEVQRMSLLLSPTPADQGAGR